MHRFELRLENAAIYVKIYGYRNAQLLTENCFHSVFVVVKSIREETRQGTFFIIAGSRLVNIALSAKPQFFKN